MWTNIFHMCPYSMVRLAFIGENFVLKKSELPLILFYFKRENKIRKKTLKNCDSIVLEKHIFEKPESRFEDQVTY